MEVLRKVRDEDNKTIIMVTHDENLTKYGDQSYTLKDGLLST
jgi:putative ABC transport system ATP-binding protein